MNNFKPAPGLSDTVLEDILTFVTFIWRDNRKPISPVIVINAAITRTWLYLHLMATAVAVLIG